MRTQSHCLWSPAAVGPPRPPRTSTVHRVHGSHSSHIHRANATQITHCVMECNEDLTIYHIDPIINAHHTSYTHIIRITYVTYITYITYIIDHISSYHTVYRASPHMCIGRTHLEWTLVCALPSTDFHLPPTTLPANEMRNIHQCGWYREGRGRVIGVWRG